MNIRPGNYQARAQLRTDPETGNDHYVFFGYSPNTNTPQVVAYFEILDGPMRGIVLPWFGFFTDDSRERTRESLRLLGWDGDDLRSIDDFVLNNEVSVTVEVDTTSDGKTRARVAWVNQPGAGFIRLKNAVRTEKEFDTFLSAAMGENNGGASKGGASKGGASKGGASKGARTKGRPPRTNQRSAEPPPPTDSDKPF